MFETQTSQKFRQLFVFQEKSRLSECSQMQSIVNRLRIKRLILCFLYRVRIRLTRLGAQRWHRISNSYIFLYICKILDILDIYCLYSTIKII